MDYQNFQHQEPFNPVSQSSFDQNMSSILPLALTRQLKSARGWALGMSAIYILSSIYMFVSAPHTSSYRYVAGVYVVVAAFFVYAASKLINANSTSKKLLFALGLCTLPLCPSVLPIMAVMTFFRTYRAVDTFSKYGSSAFPSDATVAAEITQVRANSRRSNRIAMIVIGSIFVTMVGLALLAALLSTPSN